MKKVYIVLISVKSETQFKFLEWMKEDHLKKIALTDLFNYIGISTSDNKDENGNFDNLFTYNPKSQSDWIRYQKDYQPILKQEFLAKWTKELNEVDIKIHHRHEGNEYRFHG